MRKKIHIGLIFFSFFTILFSDSAQAQVVYRKMAFKDEFNKAAAAPIDSSKWTAETGGGGWGNQELQYYTNSIDNAYHDGQGSLVIKAIKLTPPLNLTCWNGPCQFTGGEKHLLTATRFDRL